jgi:replicative DNA helicase
MTIQQAPQNTELEKNIIATCLVSPSDCLQVLDILNEKDFYSLDNQILFKHIKKIGLKNKGIVSEVLLGSEIFDKEGINLKKEISNIISFAPITPDSVKSSEKIKQISIRRQIYLKAQKAISDSLNAGYEGDLLDDIQKSFTEVVWDSGDEQIIHCSEVTHNVLFEVEEKIKNPEYKKGYNTGFKNLDILPGEYIVLAARTSIGKTAFAGQVCQNLVNNKVPTLFISLEMVNERVMERFFSNQGMFNSLKFKDVSFTKTEYNELKPLKEYFDELPLFFLKTENLNPGNLRKIVRLAVKKYGIKAVILDYITKLDLKVGGVKNKENAVSEASNTIQQIARGLNVSIIALAQLNRSFKDRQNKEPVLTDLRDSGSLEMDACQVWFLHKPGLYVADGETPNPNLTDLIVAKNRNGSLGKIRLFHDLTTSSFHEIENNNYVSA